MTVDTLGRDVELTQIGLFFIVTSGLVALFAAFFVWTRWDSKKTTADENADQSEEEKPVKKPLQPSPFRKEDRKQSKWKLEKAYF
ncbi:hypothetical protein AB6A40_011279 [Gnathostoma spinigerum]|uniref:ATP synthase F0 subunit 8 n=1 Tax=Gnathostoma spinigerum TaxID=75299 RepID=A0ABD6F4H6_9BILA